MPGSARHRLQLRDSNVSRALQCLFFHVQHSVLRYAPREGVIYLACVPYICSSHARLLRETSISMRSCDNSDNHNLETGKLNPDGRRLNLRQSDCGFNKVLYRSVFIFRTPLRSTVVIRAEENGKSAGAVLPPDIPRHRLAPPRRSGRSSAPTRRLLTSKRTTRLKPHAVLLEAGGAEDRSSWNQGCEPQWASARNQLAH